jgi:heme/copper-type cytochrome/quinol oxidase subunit 4
MWGARKAVGNTEKKKVIVNVLGIIMILVVFIFVPEKYLIYKLLVIYVLTGGILLVKMRTNIFSDLERRLGFGNTWVVYVWIITITLIVGTLLFKSCTKYW